MRTALFSKLRGSLSVVGAAALAASVGATGCFLSQGEEVSTSPDEVVGGAQASALLKSTLVLDAGCIATKIGPRHLLLSARCASGNEALAKGKIVGFRTATAAATASETEPVLAPADAGSDAKRSVDAGADAAAGSGEEDEEAAPAAKPDSSRAVTIAEVNIHPSFEGKCTDADACGLGMLDASDAPDVALVILEDDLETIPSVPVDLDAVGQSDRLFVLGSGCDIVGAEEGGAIQIKRTTAVPPKSATHAGSPYKAEPQKIGTLGASYVVTAGSAWRSTEMKICSSDLGAPVFRAGVAAVAGITSNFTMWKENTWEPVTVHHTRVDTQSRFKIGVWLETQGALTLHSCSESAGGCKKLDYTGGEPVPPSGGGSKSSNSTAPGDAGDEEVLDPSADGGGEGEIGPGPTTSEEEELADLGPPEDDYGYDEDYSDAAAARKKKKKQEGGCSASPGPMPTGEMGLFLGLGLAFMAMGRRRRSR